MRERERLLWNILIILLLIIAGYEGYNAYRIGRQVRAYQNALSSSALGSEDPQLRETVGQLESELQNRLSYQFETGKDPLDLTQVIYARRLLHHLGLSESLEAQGKMRLSCTVMSDHPAVVVKYQGRSQILRLGETVNGYRVAEIKPQYCVMVRGDERLTLSCEKAPETLDVLERQQEGEITVTASDTLAPMENF